jgi:hypothetical protein
VCTGYLEVPEDVMKLGNDAIREYCWDHEPDADETSEYTVDYGEQIHGSFSVIWKDKS